MSRGVASIFLGNLGSKGLALLREVLFAAWFGTGQTAAAFRVAQTLYLLPVQALLGDALSAGLLPLYRKLRDEEGADAARTLVLWACLYGLVFSLAISASFYWFADSLTALVAPGASAEARSLAARLIEILALSTPFYVLSGLLGYVEAAYGRYSGIAWRPMAINLGAIAGASLAVLFGHDHWLAIALVVSHVALFVWTVVAVRRVDRLTPTQAVPRGLSGALLRRLAVNTVPLLGLPLAAQVNVVVERIVSSWLGTEIIPSVDYARFLADTMVQLVAVPLGVLTMATHGGSSDAAATREHLRRTTALVFSIAVPIALFVANSAEDLVRLLFARGAFGEESVSTTTAVLRWMGAGLAANIPAYYLVKALNAQLRNREALGAIVAGCVANMAVNVALWRVLGPQTIGVGVVAFGLCVGALTMSGLALWGALGPLIGWLLVYAIAALALLHMLPPLPYPAALCASAVVVAGGWLTLTTLVPSARLAAGPLLQRLPGAARREREAG